MQWDLKIVNLKSGISKVRLVRGLTDQQVICSVEQVDRGGPGLRGTVPVDQLGKVEQTTINN